MKTEFKNLKEAMMYASDGHSFLWEQYLEAREAIQKAEASGMFDLITQDAAMTQWNAFMDLVDTLHQTYKESMLSIDEDIDKVDKMQKMMKDLEKGVPDEHGFVESRDKRLRSVGYLHALCKITLPTKERLHKVGKKLRAFIEIRHNASELENKLARMFIGMFYHPETRNLWKIKFDDGTIHEGYNDPELIQYMKTQWFKLSLDKPQKKDDRVRVEKVTATRPPQLGQKCVCPQCHYSITQEWVVKKGHFSILKIEKPCNALKCPACGYSGLQTTHTAQHDLIRVKLSQSETKRRKKRQSTKEQMTALKPPKVGEACRCKCGYTIIQKAIPNRKQPLLITQACSELKCAKCGSPMATVSVKTMISGRKQYIAKS